MKKKETVQDRINEILDKEGLSIPTLAKKINVSAQTVRNVVLSRNNPSYEILVKLVNTFDWVTASWLLTGERDQSGLNSDTKKLYRIIEKQHDTIDLLTRRLLQDVDHSASPQKNSVKCIVIPLNYSSNT